MKTKKTILLSIALLVMFCAGAQTPVISSLKYNNDINVDLAVGLWGNPIPVDYDGDGLMDIIVSSPDRPYRGLYYFRNIGTKEKPLFDKAVKLSSIGKNYISCSNYGGALHVLSPECEYEDFLANLYSKPKAIHYQGDKIELNGKRSYTWNYVDWDDDGDPDIIVGVDTWKDYGWDNAYDSIGVWKNGPLHGFVYLLENQDGTYMNRGRILAGNEDIDVYGAPNPCVADFDGDGDLDMICGEFTDELTWFENVGTRDKPVFAKGRKLQNRRGLIRFHIAMIVPTVCDFDGDGANDLVVGDEDGRIAWLRNTGKVNKHMPVFESPYYFRQKADIVKFGALATPFSYDWDGDGNDDIVCGNSAGEICLIRNMSGGPDPSWAEPVLFKVDGKPFRILAGMNGSIQGPAERKWGYTVLSVSDIDGDGKPDIVFNSIFGQILWMRNLGSEDGLTLSQPQPIIIDTKDILKPEWTWWNPEPGMLVTQWRTSPVMIDWNGDGANDLVTLDQSGYLCLYEREKNAGKVIFKPGKRIFYGENCSLYSNSKGVLDSLPGALRLNDGKAGSSGRRKFCFVDWDGDGRLDLIVDSKNACWFKSLYEKGGNTYFKYMGDLCDVRLEGHTTCPTPVDWDGNGVFDLLLGAEDGHFYIIKNNQQNDRYKN